MSIGNDSMLQGGEGPRRDLLEKKTSSPRKPLEKWRKLPLKPLPPKQNGILSEKAPSLVENPDVISDSTSEISGVKADPPNDVVTGENGVTGDASNIPKKVRDLINSLNIEDPSLNLDVNDTRKLNALISNQIKATSNPGIGGSWETMYSLSDKFRPLAEFLKIHIDEYIPSTSEISGVKADPPKDVVTEENGGTVDHESRGLTNYDLESEQQRPKDEGGGGDGQEVSIREFLLGGGRPLPDKRAPAKGAGGGLPLHHWDLESEQHRPQDQSSKEGSE